MKLADAFPDTVEPTGQWVKEGACIDEPDAMFPDNNEAGIAYAKQFCARCPVRSECLTDAIRTDDNEHGIRGGMKPSERRELAKTVGRPGTAGTQLPKPPQPKEAPPKTLAEAFARRTVRTDDGHLTWYGGVQLKFQGAKYTALQAAFIIGHAREPEGPVRRTCGRDCFRADHLTDGRIRDSEATCGTRAGYQRHKKHGDVACAPCRQANTDADNRLRRTGTTKAAA